MQKKRGNVDALPLWNRLNWDCCGGICALVALDVFFLSNAWPQFSQKVFVALFLAPQLGHTFATGCFFASSDGYPQVWQNLEPAGLSA